MLPEGDLLGLVHADMVAGNVLFAARLNNEVIDSHMLSFPRL